MILFRLASNMAKRDVVVSLYKSIESGYSQCHHTGNRKKASGGWYGHTLTTTGPGVTNVCCCRYFESCLHGCIIVSKALFLAESVRDPVEFKLSKKFNSPTNILYPLL